MSSDKDYAGVAQELAHLFDIVIVTRSRHPRALAGDILFSEFAQFGREVQTAESVADALDKSLGLAGNKGFICATGSLFIVGEALEWAHEPGY
jgi:dihydrofolate synthase/folylpolyglutamate synthase